MVGGNALLCRSGHPRRRGEVAIVESTLRHQGIMTNSIDEESNAFIDGGDVLFTGTEFFVGVSERTNELGVNALRGVFNVWSLILSNAVFHLVFFRNMKFIPLVCRRRFTSSRL